MKTLILVLAIALTGCGAANKGKAELVGSDAATIGPEWKDGWTDATMNLTKAECVEEVLDKYEYTIGYAKAYCGCMVDVIATRYTYAELLTVGEAIVKETESDGTKAECKAQAAGK